MSKRYIVTGGAGFIGCNLALALNARGHRDLVLVDRLDHDAKRANLNAVEHDTYLDKAAFREAFRADAIAPADAVFHLGACSSTTETDEAYLADNNLRYSQELCEWCLRHGSRFIYASSAATYGDGSLGYSDEDDVTPTLRPLNPYGASKQQFDLWALQRGLLDRIAGLKYFNVYGPREDHKAEMRSVVRKAYDQILETGELRLFKSYRPDYGNGEQERDFVYVDDAVQVTLFFEDRRDVSGLFNCGTGRARTWLALARATFAAMAREPRVVFIDMPSDLRDRYQYYTQAETGKLRRAGCDTPFASLEQGIHAYVRDYLSRR